MLEEVSLLIPKKDTAHQVLHVGTVGSDPTDIRRLFKVWQSIEALPSDSLNIEVNFHYCNFLNHLGVAFLGGLIQWIKHRGGNVTVDWSSLQKKIHANLAQNGFLQACGQQQQPWEGNSIPYRNDTTHDANAIGDYLCSKWLGKGWVNISPGLQARITGIVAEVYLNASEHSHSPIGVFSCGQHYPKKGYLHLTVIDFGIGIAQSARTVPSNQQFSSIDALQWALQRGTSTRENEGGRGLGLHLLQDFITVNQGALYIFSNDSCVTIDNNGVNYKNTGINFSGTLVDIAIKCDESYYCLDSEAIPRTEPWF
ncbi:MAG: ATP-binding protein [Cyanobacteria bacterium J06621_3]